MGTYPNGYRISITGLCTICIACKSIRINFMSPEYMNTVCVYLSRLYLSKKTVWDCVYPDSDVFVLDRWVCAKLKTPSSE